MEIYYCPQHYRKTQFQTFYFIYIIEIPTQKGEHSWKYTELSIQEKRELDRTAT